MKQILIIIVASLLLAGCSSTIVYQKKERIPVTTETTDANGYTTKVTRDSLVVVAEYATTENTPFSRTEVRDMTHGEGDLGDAEIRRSKAYANRKAADGDHAIAMAAAHNDTTLVGILARADDPELALALLIKSPPAGVQVIEAQGRKLMFQNGYMFFPGGRRAGYRLGSFEYGAALGQMGISTQEIARMLQL